MMKGGIIMKIYHVNAFTEHLEGGNPAGVVLNADQLTTIDKLNIAKEVGYSETAFVSRSTVADFKVEFFTPSDEVDLCGHATIATFSVLFKENIIKSGVYTQETKAGVLEVDIKESGDVYMTQLTPTAYDVVDSGDVAKSLGISVEDIIEPVQVFSTGLKDIIVQLKSLHTIKTLKPDFDQITAISKQYDCTGYHVFTLETLHGSTAHCRNFAPLYAIDEEAATGTASGALSGYLFKHNRINSDDGVHILNFEQGYEMNRPSEIHGKITLKNNQVTSVIIGGKGKIQKT